jgi:hypothetical protein
MATAAEGAVSGLLSFFSGLADRAVGGLSDLAGKIGGVISTAVTDLKDSAESTVHGILSWFTNLPQRFIDSIGDLGSRLGSFFAGGLRAAWNAVANLWNSTIGGTGFDIPDAIPLIGGDSVRVPNLPTLDTGGIIMHPTLAALAMNSKPEAIIPLDSDVGQTMLAKSTGATETRQGHTFVTNVTGVAADPQELARLNGLEMTWMLRTQAA